MKKKLIWIIPLVLALDLITKQIVMNQMQIGESIAIIPGFFWIRYVVNTGAAWSLLEGNRILFVALGLGTTGVLSYFFYKEKNPLELTGIAFMMAGTLGNVIDRIVLGYVRDFFSFNIFGYYFPVFNIADISLFVGVGLLILEYLILEKKHG